MTTTHGLSKTTEYYSWNAMICRCTHKTHPSYKNHGARGIRVCTRWLKFENFLADMGKKPKGTTLEREDNDGDYRKSNCKWATRKEQQNNLRVNRRISFNGKSRTVAQWARKLGISDQTIYWRLNQDWSTEKVLSAKGCRL